MNIALSHKQKAKTRVRSCINCGQDETTDLFTFTRQFLQDVRRWPASRLDAMSWSEETTSTIVKCRQCGCNYIRDVFVADDNTFRTPFTEEQMSEYLLRYGQKFSRDNINTIQYVNAVIDRVLRIILNRTSHELSLLDFGSSLGHLPVLARMRGFKTVKAYDPKFRPNISEIVSTRHPIDFEFIRNKEELFKHAPFDVITCQSADEHFFDLQNELRLMRDLLSDKGIIYLTHPTMDLDADLECLRNEGHITDAGTIHVLRKSYHPHHLNYVPAKVFSDMLKRNGLREKRVLLTWHDPDVRSLHVRNVARLGRQFVKYILDSLGIKYKKTMFFLERSD